MCNDENISESVGEDDKDKTTDENANIAHDEEENFSGGFQVVISEKDNNIELTDDLQPLIVENSETISQHAVHVVKVFCRSSTKNNQTLQKYTR